MRNRRAAFAAWLYTGPVGHFYAGLADWLTLLARYWWARRTHRLRRRVPRGRAIP